MFVKVLLAPSHFTVPEMVTDVVTIFCYCSLKGTCLEGMSDSSQGLIILAITIYLWSFSYPYVVLLTLKAYEIKRSFQIEMRVSVDLCLVIYS